METTPGGLPEGHTERPKPPMTSWQKRVYATESEAGADLSHDPLNEPPDPLGGLEGLSWEQKRKARRPRGIPAGHPHRTRTLWLLFVFGCRDELGSAMWWNSRLSWTATDYPFHTAGGLTAANAKKISWHCFTQQVRRPESLGFLAASYVRGRDPGAAT